MKYREHKSGIHIDICSGRNFHYCRRLGIANCDYLVGQSGRMKFMLMLSRPTFLLMRYFTISLHINVTATISKKFGK